MAIDVTGSEARSAGAPFPEGQASGEASRQVLSDLQGHDLGGLCREMRRELDQAGVVFRSDVDDAPFQVDPVPRIILAAEWDPLARGLIQRVRALERFLEDVYGERRIIAEGVVPEEVVANARYHESQARGLAVRTWIAVAGLDLVRDVDGSFKVLEDNVRTPSGLAYAMAARGAVADRVPVPDGHRLRRLDTPARRLGDAVRAAAPEGAAEPFAVLLSDGPRNSAYYEHATLAELLGIPLVTATDLGVRHGRLWLTREALPRAVDVVYRRTDSDRLFEADGRPGPLTSLLLEPLRNGTLSVVNAFGSGVADDKLVHSYVEEMVRFYLGEEPLLASVRTYDPSAEAGLEQILDRLAELVVKPRDGYGGRGVIIGPHASAAQLERTRRDLLDEPSAFVAQELIMLSCHPTVCDGRLHPRHVDLRPFVLTIGEDVEVLPGGLTRVALDADSMVVNSSQQGGAKDTWVLDPGETT